MRTTKMLASCATLLVLHAAAARAADPDLVAAARAYVESAKASKNVLGLMHTGASFTGCDPLGVCKVTDGDDKVIPGEFAVKVRLNWAYRAGDQDWTEVYYFFNANGRFTGLRPGKTTAIISQPFAVGGVVVDAIRSVLLEDLKGKPDEKTWAPIIKAADAQKLTEIGLALGQP